MNSESSDPFGILKIIYRHGNDNQPQPEFVDMMASYAKDPSKFQDSMYEDVKVKKIYTFTLGVRYDIEVGSGIDTEEDAKTEKIIERSLFEKSIDEIISDKNCKLTAYDIDSRIRREYIFSGTCGQCHEKQELNLQPLSEHEDYWVCKSCGKIWKHKRKDFLIGEICTKKRMKNE